MSLLSLKKCFVCEKNKQIRQFPDKKSVTCTNCTKITSSYEDEEDPDVRREREISKKVYDGNSRKKKLFIKRIKPLLGKKTEKKRDLGVFFKKGKPLNKE